jgi:hypothetical protein
MVAYAKREQQQKEEKGHQWRKYCTKDLGIYKPEEPCKVISTAVSTFHTRQHEGPCKYAETVIRIIHYFRSYCCDSEGRIYCHVRRKMPSSTYTDVSELK